MTAAIGLVLSWIIAALLLAFWLGHRFAKAELRDEATPPPPRKPTPNAVRAVDELLRRHERVAKWHCDGCNAALFDAAEVGRWLPPSCNGGGDPLCARCAK